MIWNASFSGIPVEGAHCCFAVRRQKSVGTHMAFWSSSSVGTATKIFWTDPAIAEVDMSICSSIRATHQLQNLGQCESGEDATVFEIRDSLAPSNPEW